MPIKLSTTTVARTNHSLPLVATTKQTMKIASSSIGAPAQRTQSSRKGKRAWRKNVDLEEVEEGLEELRAEERLTGYVS